MMELSPETRVEQAERTAARVIDGQAVVIVIDRQHMHTLNEVGTFVWERAERRTIGEIVDLLVDAYPVDRDSALQHVVAFVGDLVKFGALSVSEASS